MQRLCDVVMSPICLSLSKILHTERLGFKIIWALFSITMIVGCSYFLNKSVLDYLEYNFISSISHRLEQPTEFPTISFCSTGRLDNSTPIDDILLDCDFNNENCNSKRYFKSFNDPIYGLCFRFNMGINDQGEKFSVFNSFHDGARYGLALKLKMISSHLGGIRLSVHNYSTTPISLKDSGVSVSPGGETYVSVNRVFNIQLDEPYNKCLKDVKTFNLNKTLINFISNMNEKYTQNKCNEYCFYLSYLEKSDCECNTSMNDLALLYENCIDPYNKSTSMYNCTENFRKNFHKPSIYDKCSNFCPLECDSITYLTSSSYIEYHFDDLEKKIENDSYFNGFTTYKEVKHSFYLIYVYYEELKYTLIIQEPKILLDDFIANIGGIIGVFIGCSLLSLIEFAEAIGEICIHSIERKIFSRTTRA